MQTVTGMTQATSVLGPSERAAEFGGDGDQREMGVSSGRRAVACWGGGVYRAG